MNKSNTLRFRTDNEKPLKILKESQLCHGSKPHLTEQENST